ncbi:ParB N-terminal domain-containing protein [Streptomyces sp. NPDC059853]|uniref:ParB/RepB/Spo0J family partition protein n=1 Tax=Streptomyces sp. NPDC059853 TaxID=3346973 RepID=UPI00364E949D
MIPTTSEGTTEGDGHSPTVVTVRLHRLLPGDSPRLSGEDSGHVRTLAESEGELPPILVHRATMRVIDGLHRLRAAALRGDDRVPVIFFDGTADAAFLAAVRANVRHGLPLTRAERKAAAARIIRLFPDLSDRAVGRASGLSGTVVGTIRAGTARRRTAPEANRIGLDGRLRPVDGAEGRRAAQRVIAARPNASLREIAQEAGISPNTVRDVRARLQRGEGPVPPRLRRSPSDAHAEPGQAPPSAPVIGPGSLATLRNMHRDPSLRFTESGRRLLRLLNTHIDYFGQWHHLREAIPAYHLDSVAALAREYATVWKNLAEELEHRARQETEVTGASA